MSLIILYFLIFLVVCLGGCRGVQFTNANFNGISAGTPFTLTFAGASGTVTLVLLNADFNVISTIASGLTDTFFVWTPSTSLSQGEYNLKIEASDGESNLSSQFQISVGSVVSPVSSLASIQNTPTTVASSPSSSTSPISLIESIPPTSSFSSPTPAVSSTASISTTPATPAPTVSSSPSPTSSVSSTSTSSAPIPPASSSQSSGSSISSVSSTTSSPSSSPPISTQQSSTISSSPLSTPLTSTQQPSITSSTLNSTPAPHKGLSNGAKAGIAIGTLIGAILLIGIIALFFFRYGKKVALKMSESDNTWYALGKVEGGSSKPRVSELEVEFLPEKKMEQGNGREAVELEDVSPVEIGGIIYTEKVELEATQHNEDRLNLHEMG